MSQQAKQYIVRLEHPFPAEKRATIALALANDLKSTVEKWRNF